MIVMSHLMAIVDEINAEVEAKGPGSEVHYMSACYSNGVLWVEWLGRPMWCSEDDECDDESDVESIIRTESQGLIDSIKTVSVASGDGKEDPVGPSTEQGED